MFAIFVTAALAHLTKDFGEIFLLASGPSNEAVFDFLESLDADRALSLIETTLR